MIANVTLQSYAPLVAHLLAMHATDALDMAQIPSWLTKTLVPDGGTMSWTSSGNTRTTRHKKTLVFCHEAIIDGAAHPFVVGACLATSPPPPLRNHSTLHCKPSSVSQCTAHEVRHLQGVQTPHLPEVRTPTGRDRSKRKMAYLVPASTPFNGKNCPDQSNLPSKI